MGILGDEVEGKTLGFAFAGTAVIHGGIQVRSWNPFDKHNMQNWYFVLSLGLNGGLWGFARLGILNFADALWLNLTSVFVMGFLWLEECIQFEIITDKPLQEGHPFSTPKLLGLFALTIILIGYELTTRDKELEEDEKELDAAEECCR